VGLEDMVESRVSQHPMGFGADVKPRHEKDLPEIFSHLHPDDLIRYGMIPEFVGRLPIVVTLEELGLETLKSIITEPKNAIVKQYVASLKLDNVDLVFTSEAIDAIARKALEHKTGARGLRSIVESIMMDIMFVLPSIKGVKRVIVTEEVIENKAKPEIEQVGVKKSA